jgi:hypothetical protein
MSRHTFAYTFHEILSNAFARADWYAVAPLDAEEQRNIAEARTRLQRENKVPTPGRIVAELNFGFWVSLVRSRYAQTLWDTHLHRSFRMPLRRDSTYHALASENFATASHIMRSLLDGI